MTQNTGTSKKKKNITEKGQYFLSLISESETHIFYIFITQSEIFQAFIYFNFTLLFSHLADAFIQSDLQMRKSY